MANFINPYNFVPLAKTAPSRSTRQEEVAEELYTGKIQYEIETLSPLFIPNTSNDKILGVKGENDSENAYHKSYDFFSYNDLSEETDSKTCYEPVIPGSEIRGMVRSVYEAMTNSCLSAVDENVSLSKRTAEHFATGILLKKGDGYELYAAKDYLYRVNRRADFSVPSYAAEELPADGSHVFFTRDTKSAPDRPHYAKPFACNISSVKDHGQQLEGYLIKGEPGPELAKSRGSKCDFCPRATREKCEKNKEKNCYLLEKHCAHVFALDRQIDAPVKVMKGSEAEEASRRMDVLLKIYGKNHERKGMYDEYRRTWEKFKTDRQMEGIAVYYSVIDDICYLSPACITREVYKNTLEKILGGHRACSDADRVCPACRLFGTVNGKLRIASKLRFADAYVAEKRGENKDYYDKPITLLELSTPKLSSTEFYLRRPDDGRTMNWTYDYYTLLESDNSVSIKTYTPQISGRKFYWHSPETAEWVRSVQDKIEKNERNKTVRPLTKRVVFRGELYFEGITKEQLDELILILNLSAMKEGKYALKLGSAKPLGFGSVAMRIEEKGVTLRTVSLDENAGLVYTKDAPYNYQATGLTQEILDTGILTILDTQALKKMDDTKVHYPYERLMDPGEEEGFSWFTDNRIGKRQDRDGILDLNRTDQAPKSRKQIIYQAYMQPLTPTLLHNEAGENRRQPVDNQGRNNRRQTFGGGHGRTDFKYEYKKKYHGTVSGYHKERYAQIVLEEGGRASVPVFKVKNRGNEEDIKKVLPIGTKVTVIYMGKNTNGYDTWSCEK